MKIRGVLLLLLVAVFTAGCGTSPIPANGTISYKGAPVADANVGFVPKVGAAEQTGSATTDTQGKFSLSVLPGEYTVTVSPKSAPATPNDYSLPPAPPFPVRYGDPGVSDLKVEVKNGDANQFPLELKD